MIESIVPRVAGQSVDGVTTTDVIPNMAPWNTQSIPGPTAAVNADPFNGHEWNTALEDLQYACIAQLPTAKPCPCTASSATFNSCGAFHPNDCCILSHNTDALGNSGADYDKPLCQPPSGGAQATTQYFLKGYPGLREIAVLHDYATSSAVASQGNSVVASICPKDLTSAASSPGYGYNPAALALIDRMSNYQGWQLLARALAVNSNGSISRNLVEVVPGSNLTGLDCATYCNDNDRQTPSAATTADVTVAMQQQKICGGPGQPACSTLCECLLPTGAKHSFAHE